MTSTADLIIERRRMRRSLAIWRILAVLAVLAAVVVVAARFSVGGSAAGADHVAEIEITGVIQSDGRRAEMLDRIAKNDRVKALVVNINSPGGTVAGSEALFLSLRKVAEKKPVVATMAEVAASGGYVAALAADHVVAYETTLTGSIGVVAQVPNVNELLESIGVEVAEVKSSPLKAAPSPTSPLTEEGLAALERTIEDSYAWFRGLVSERRGLEGQGLEAVADGRVFTGRQALELGLVDALGPPERARDWLADEREISRDLPARDYDWTEVELPFPFDILRGIAEPILGPFWTSDRGLLAPTPRLLALFGA